MQTLIEVLPPALIIHLKRFRYDGGTVKIGKSIQFTSELEIPPGTTLLFLTLAPAADSDTSWFCGSRRHGTHCP